MLLRKKSFPKSHNINFRLPKREAFRFGWGFGQEVRSFFENLEEREAASQVTVSLGEGSSDRLTESSPGSVYGSSLRPSLY